MTPLFGKRKAPTKKQSAKRPLKKAAAKAAPLQKASTAAGASVLLKPRITEKAAHLTAKNVYTFDVSPRATKSEVIAAISEFYNVTPKKVAIVKIIGKRVRLRTRRGWGTKNATKKAYVYLKEGDRIEFAS